MHWRHLGTMSILALGLLAFSSTTSQAQGDADSCPVLVEQALTELGDNCAGLGRNSACYGYNRIDSTFTQAMAEDFFSQPADRTELTSLQSIHTAPLDVDIGQWGIAVMNVQANVPNTLPGQGVIFLLLGDVTLENAVNPEDAAQPTEPISVTTSAASNLRSGPGTNSNVVGSVTQGTALEADALSADSAWVRVLYNDVPAWIHRDLLTGGAALDSLPVLNEELRTPMQAFTFRSGLGAPACSEAPPSLLLIQGPQSMTVNLTVNGADLSIGSTVALQQTEAGELQLMALNRRAQVDGLTVPEGYTVFAPLDEEGSNVAGSWGEFRPLSADELATLSVVEQIPPDLLHYAITLPSPRPQLTAPVTVQTSEGGQADCTSFRPTSPLDGLPAGTTTFYWDGAPGATGYRVNIYNENEALAAWYETGADQTSLAVDVSTQSIGGGFVFSWEVQALVDGQVACSGATGSMYRDPCAALPRPRYAKRLPAMLVFLLYPPTPTPPPSSPC